MRSAYIILYRTSRVINDTKFLHGECYTLRPPGIITTEEISFRILTFLL
jgi:hypothetical protein